MPARFNVEGPSNAQWLEGPSGSTPTLQTGSPSALFRNIQQSILQWMLQQGVDQHYPYPAVAARTGFIVHPSSADAHAAGAHPFAVDGILGTDYVTMIHAIAQATGASAIAAAALSDLQAHRISPAVLAFGISLARQGRSISIDSSAVMPVFGQLPTGAPRGGVILPTDTASPTPAPTFATPGSNVNPPQPPATTPPAETPAPSTTTPASFTPETPAPTSWTSSVPKWAWWVGGAVVLVGGGLAVGSAMKHREQAHDPRRGARV